MGMQYLLVIFPQDCAVLADGSGVGNTNRVLMLPAGEYEITLDSNGHTPLTQDAILDGTSLNNPLVINFQVIVPPPTKTSP